MGTVINVGGTSRSGSTMLHLILGNAPNAFAAGAPLNLYRPTMKHHFDLACSCGQRPCPVWRRLAPVPEHRFYTAALRELEVDYVIDSSKEISWLLDARRWTKAQGITTVNVFIWKEPLQLAYSFWKRGQGVQFWRAEFVKYYRRVLQARLPLVTVNLGALTQDPESTVRKLCEVLDMPYFPGKERFWEREHHLLGGSMSVRKQAQEGRSSFIAGTRFPPEFERHVAELRRRLESDLEVQRLLGALQEADVSRLAAREGLRQRYDRGHPYAPWYYAQRAKRVLRRRFPRDYDLAAAERVATVPGRDRS